MHLLELGKKIKEGIQAEGMVGFLFNTVGVSDASTPSISSDSVGRSLRFLS